MKISCLIFDLDGTLFSTEKANFLAYREAFKEVGRDLTEENYRKAFGLRADKLIPALAPNISAQHINDIKKHKAHHYRKNINHVVPNSYLIELIKSMHGGHKLALATTASRVNAEFILDYFGLKQYFDVTIYGEDVSRGKPDPECYNVCIERCGVKPAECLIFEDSDVGLEAGLATGAAVVQIPTP